MSLQKNASVRKAGSRHNNVQDWDRDSGSVIALVPRIVMSPRAILIEMLGAELLRVGSMVPGVELTVGALIAIGIGNADIAFLVSRGGARAYQCQTGEDDGNRCHF